MKPDLKNYANQLKMQNRTLADDLKTQIEQNKIRKFEQARSEYKQNMAMRRAQQTEADLLESESKRLRASLIQDFNKDIASLQRFQAKKAEIRRADKARQHAKVKQV